MVELECLLRLAVRRLLLKEEGGGESKDMKTAHQYPSMEAVNLLAHITTQLLPLPGTN